MTSYDSRHKNWAQVRLKIDLIIGRT